MEINITFLTARSRSAAGCRSNSVGSLEYQQVKREQLRKGRNTMGIDDGGGSGILVVEEEGVEEGMEEPSMVSFDSSLPYFNESATWWVFFWKIGKSSSSFCWYQYSQWLLGCFVSLLFWSICSRVESHWDSKSHWNSKTPSIFKSHSQLSDPWHSGVPNIFFVKGARGFDRCWMPKQEGGRWCRTVNESRSRCSLRLSSLPW